MAKKCWYAVDGIRKKFWLKSAAKKAALERGPMRTASSRDVFRICPVLREDVQKVYTCQSFVDDPRFRCRRLVGRFKKRWVR